MKKLKENVWEIPKDKDMHVPGIIFASDKLMEQIAGDDKTIGQVRNVAQLKGIKKQSIAMSDCHCGYGFPIGGVAGFDTKEGIISPGGVGYDINCGVRLLATTIPKEALMGKREELINELNKAVPSGVGRGGEFVLTPEDMQDVLNKGSHWAKQKGYATDADLDKTEDTGIIQGADAQDVSDKAKKRGRNQLGTLGSGNHFIEIQEVETVYDENVANVFGLTKGQLCIMIHTGSRGTGHQTCSDYIHKMEDKYGWEHLPDRELTCAPIKSELGTQYRKAMAGAANFAFANRQIITHQIRNVLKENFPEADVKVVYDIAHNIAKFEKHVVDGKEVELCVHRKGATRSFGPGRKEIPADYRDVGCPIFIPGSMGTYSYVLVGTKEAEEISLASTAHGAGRVMSRSQAKREITPEHVKQELAAHGVAIKAGSVKGMVEEAPEAYKDVNEVVRVSDELGIGKMVVRLKPIAVVKG
ncbi:MAG: RtcB family protein [Candidatus Woesearchaeota archaeon]|jgi:tRNA-splicing ligase RtcB|nr:RtcB family protein [Candidatus Woesearchaeota archaeon]MDP7181103.1 RtcB family protein [Candidatus Woesearchaeota archaeon]MDP7198276.1 RtcB family protein [Candidatus Woesearchaeota archaeon]MDP7467378.1 RtcB family protein [Candidatus Woesearchaeota archaeon]MDP7647605.1 RtcB family protein [Candidatus Woesearchaeota archaeon]